MNNQTTQKYAWLPIELQLTGYDDIWYKKRLEVERHARGADSHKMWLSNFEKDFHESGSKRYYNGTPEILGLLDKENWPPGRTEEFLIWNPADLEMQGRNFCSFLYGKIGAFLYHRQSAELNLFDLCWKDVICNYVQHLPERLKGLQLPKEFYTPDMIGLISRDEIFPKGTTREQEAQKLKDDEFIASLSPETAATFAEVIRDLGRGEVKWSNFNENQELARNGSSPELIFLSQQSDHPFLRYRFNNEVRNQLPDDLSDDSLEKSFQGISDTGLPVEIEARINSNLALQLRLKLWWGWSGAPFMCIENMMEKQLSYLVREGYLRHLGGMEYELPSEKASLFESEPTTQDRLKEACKLLNPSKALLTVGGTLAKEALAASAPYWINLGKYLLGL
jgi:hypothetical protein